MIKPCVSPFDQRFVYLLLSLFGLVSGSAAQEFIPLRTTWRYMDDGVDRYTQNPPFYNPAYNDASWKTGTARLGYGGDGETTAMLFGGVPSNKNITAYLRREFTWDGTVPPDADTLMLEFSRDDGAMIYLNGNLVERSNMPAGTVGNTTRASAGVSNNDEWLLFQKALDPSLLRQGTNVIAVSLHQDAPDSSDTGFDLRAALTRRERFFKQQVLLPVGHGMETLLGLLDVTGDGAPEMFYGTESLSADTFEIRINDGHGSFGPRTVIDSSFEPRTMKVLNLNGDNRPDLAVTNSSGIVVFRNDGGGAFTRTANLTGLSVSATTEVADVDGDGRDDLIYLSQSKIGWRRNNGSGSFGAEVVLLTFTSGSEPASLTVTEANGDGHPDILVTTPSTAQVRLLVNQGGTNPAFVTGIVDASPQYPRGIASADLDGDGDIDFVVVSRLTSSLTSAGLLYTYLNNGSGVYIRQPTPLPVERGYVLPLLADVDKDGDTDLIYSGENGVMYVHENDGRGNWVFRRALSSPLQTFSAVSTIIGDVDGDGNPDIARATGNQFEPVIWYRNVQDALPRINSFTATPNTLAAAGQSTLAWDVENAAKVTISPGVTVTPGVSTANVTVNGETIYTLRAENRFGAVEAKATVFIAETRWSAPLTGPVLDSRYYGGAQLDVNGDGLLDVVYVGWTPGMGQTGTYWVPMTGNRTFGTPQRVLEGAKVYSPTAADMNRDGRLDIVTGHEDLGLVYYPVKAGGGLAAQVKIMTATTANRLSYFTVGDFDGDGDIDAATIQGNEQTVRLFLNNGSGTFSAGGTTPLPPGFRTDGMYSADVDGDGLAELIFMQDSGSSVIGWNNGAGSFTNVTTLPVSGSAVRYVHIADVNGDEINDMLTIQSSLSSDIDGPDLYLELGRGDKLLGTRGGTRLFHVQGGDFDGLSTADLDGDGDMDIFVARQASNAPLQFSLNDGNGSFSELVSITTQAIGNDGAYKLLTGDIDDDGDPDVVSFFEGNVVAVFNDGPPRPVLQVQKAATLTEGGQDAQVQINVTGLTRAQVFEITRQVGSSAGVDEVTAAPASLVTPVPGQPGKWSLTLQPGVPQVVLTFHTPDDIHAEDAETELLQFSSAEPADFTENGTFSPLVTLTIPANDYTVINKNESGEGSLAQALANAGNPLLVAARGRAAAEILFSDAGGVPFQSSPQTIPLGRTQILHPVVLRGPRAPGRLTLQLNSQEALLQITGGTDVPDGTRTVLDNFDIVRTAAFPNPAIGVLVTSAAPVLMRDMNISDKAGTGVVMSSGDLTMRSITLSGCAHAGFQMGDAAGFGTAKMVNCTLSGNRSLNDTSAGVAFKRGTLTLLNCTVTDNTGKFTGASTDGGAGVGIHPATGQTQVLRVQNTIIAGNRYDNGSSNDVFGAFTSLGGNVIGVVDGSTGFSGDRTGTLAAPLDAMLGPLAMNGNVTLTHALISITRQQRSPAINAGEASALTPENFAESNWWDQRAAPRVFPENSTLIDAGAYEILNTAPYLTGPSGTGFQGLTVLEDAQAQVLRPGEFMDDAEEGPAGLVFTVSSNTAPGLITATLSGEGEAAVLTLAFTRNLTGTGFITVDATDRYGERISSRFQVTVNPAVDPVVTARVLTSPVIAGEPAQDVFEFTLLNRGPSDASQFTLETGLTLPEHVTLASGSVTRGAFDAATGRWTLDLPEGGVALLTLKVQATREAAGGTDSVRAALQVTASAIPMTGPAEDNRAQAAVSVISPRDVAAEVIAGAGLDRQTGLTVQRVKITNNNMLPLTALRIYVSGLPEGWKLYNAAGQDAQGPYVDLPTPLNPGATVELSFEYYSATRGTVPAPQYTVVILRSATAPVAPGGAPFEITRVVPLAAGDMLLEWRSEPGKTYQVQYSTDMQSWNAAVPSVKAAASRTQWIDNGAPKTSWPQPNAGPRYYRIAELPAAE